jgi:hypothetical protein
MWRQPVMEWELTLIPRATNSKVKLLHKPPTRKLFSDFISRGLVPGPTFPLSELARSASGASTDQSCGFCTLDTIFDIVVLIPKQTNCQSNTEHVLEKAVHIVQYTRKAKPKKKKKETQLQVSPVRIITTLIFTPHA